MKIIEKEFNAITGEETINEREATAQEIAEREKFEADLLAEKEAKAQIQSKREAALSKLTSLGLTTDDLAALGL